MSEANVQPAAQVEDELHAGPRWHVAHQFDDAEQLERLQKYHGDKAQWVLDAWAATWLRPSMRGWSILPEAAKVRCPLLASRGAYKFVAQNFPRLNRPLEFKQVHEIWNRSKVSFAPMGSSTDPKRLQVKGRVFEMGMSGTMMLTQRSPDIENFYEPGMEFIAYDSVEDCAEKAKFYLRNETERARIAEKAARSKKPAGKRGAAKKRGAGRGGMPY